MTTTLSPAPFQKFFDNNGAPLAKGLLFTYLAGTTTKTTTWQDSAGSIANTNPIVLDYRGECNLWISPNVGYKYVLAPATDTDPPTNAIKTIDNIVNSQLITLYGGVDTGIANAYVLNFTANFTAYTDGIIIYWIPSNSNTGASTINVNGLGIVPFRNPDGSGLAYGTVIANQPIGVLYKGGVFYLVSPQPVTGSFLATLTGMTVATTGIINYRVINNICTLYSNSVIFGTSNTNAMTMTGLPSTVVPSQNRQCVVHTYDNGNLVISNAAITGGSSTITFNPLNITGAYVTATGTYTAAGNKGLTAFTMSYPLS